MNIMGQLPTTVLITAASCLLLFYYTYDKILPLIYLPKPFLPAEEGEKYLEISNIKKLSSDTLYITCKLEHENQELGLKTGGHIRFFGKAPLPTVEGEWNSVPDIWSETIHRKYTPVAFRLGEVDFIIKCYSPGESRMFDGSVKKFIDGGKMSRYILSLNVGDKLSISGPFCKNEYLGSGKFSVLGKSIQSKYFVGLAGGSGITPVLQILSAVVLEWDKNNFSVESFTVIFANKSVDDILCQEELSNHSRKYSNRIKVVYILNFEEGVTDNIENLEIGNLTTNIYKKYLPDPEQKPIIIMCGPPGMLLFGCKKPLAELNYDVNYNIVF